MIHIYGQFHVNLNQESKNEFRLYSVVFIQSRSKLSEFYDTKIRLLISQMVLQISGIKVGLFQVGKSMKKQQLCKLQFRKVKRILQEKLYASLVHGAYGQKIEKKLGEIINKFSIYLTTKITDFRVIYTTQKQEKFRTREIMRLF